MTTADIHDLQEHTRELLHRAEAGEQLTITVAGRAVATLGPVKRSPWRHFDEVAPVVRTQVDSGWAADRDLIDQD